MCFDKASCRLYLLDCGKPLLTFQNKLKLPLKWFQRIRLPILYHFHFHWSCKVLIKSQMLLSVSQKLYSFCVQPWAEIHVSSFPALLAKCCLISISHMHFSVSREGEWAAGAALILIAVSEIAKHLLHAYSMSTTFHVLLVFLISQVYKIGTTTTSIWKMR